MALTILWSCRSHPLNQLFNLIVTLLQMHTFGRSRLRTQKDTLAPFLRRSNWSRFEAAATVGTNIRQLVGSAVGTERAFV
jgi:hypothetical protein